MSINRTIFFLSFFSIWLVCIKAVHAEKVVTSYKTSQNLQIDGIETEDAWKNVKAVTTFDPIAQVKISIKSVYSETKIYFLVSYLDKNESRLHRCWIWDKEKEMYIEGPTREDVFVFKWKLDNATKDLSIYSDESYAADIWYWKAYRH